MCVFSTAKKKKFMASRDICVKIHNQTYPHVFEIKT